MSKQFTHLHSQTSLQQFEWSFPLHQIQSSAKSYRQEEPHGQSHQLDQQAIHKKDSFRKATDRQKQQVKGWVMKMSSAREQIRAHVQYDLRLRVRRGLHLKVN